MDNIVEASDGPSFVGSNSNTGAFSSDDRSLLKFPRITKKSYNKIILLFVNTKVLSCEGFWAGIVYLIYL